MAERIITMQSLAKVFGVDKSAISRFVKKHNLRDSLITVRSAKTGFRQTKALKEKDAIYVLELRKKEGFPVGELFFDEGYSISCLSENILSTLSNIDSISEEEKKKRDFKLFKENRRKSEEQNESLKKIVL